MRDELSSKVSEMKRCEVTTRASKKILNEVQNLKAEKKRDGHGPGQPRTVRPKKRTRTYNN